MSKNKVHMYYSKEAFYDKVWQDLSINKNEIIILICSIFIGCIGLNINSTPVVIGAMLISPLTGPLIGTGMGISLFQFKILKKALTKLFLQIFVSVVISWAYFLFSPITQASSEILARTNPTIWDAIIAMFGGIAGVIGSRQKEPNTIIPGVAIAAALMPPLCTLGFSFSIQNFEYIMGSSYLFAINAIYIIISVFIGIRLMKIHKIKIERKENKWVDWGIIAVAAAICIPSIFSAVDLVKSTQVKSQVDQFVQKKLPNAVVINKTIDKKKKKVKLTLSGKKLSKKKIDSLQKEFSQNHLTNMKLSINQIANVKDLSEENFKDYVNKVVSDKLKTTHTNSAIHSPLKDKIQKKFSDAIDALSIEHAEKKIFIELKKKVSSEQKTDLKKYIHGLDGLNNYQIKFVEKNGSS